jgi:hypothetical protein
LIAVIGPISSVRHDIATRTAKPQRLPKEEGSGKRSRSVLREAVEEGMIDPIYVPTEQQLANILTKAVTKKVVEYAVPLLGLE